MNITNVVFKQEIDDTMLEHIHILRETRLGLAEKMLENLNNTAHQLTARGLQTEPIDMDELKIELIDRVAAMRERVNNPNFIYEDEISLYSDMLVDGAPRD